MARWDPGAEERLKKAALELFREHGYDDVTVTQIAERAGLTRRSFFRYFPDKREVLFGGSERLPPAIAEAVLSAAPDAAPLTAALDALTAVGTALVEGIDHVAERRAVIDASPELQERERTKLAAVTAAMCTALEQRGTEPHTAGLLAQVATTVFQDAFIRWVKQPDRTTFTSCLDTATTTLREALTGDRERCGLG